MTRIETMIGILRKNGYRISKGRQLILSTLFDAQQPMAALDIYTILSQKNIAINKVTVYRELQFFADIGFAHAVYLQDGIKRYEIAPEKGHKHHIVCTACNIVQDVDIACHELHRLEKDICVKNNFTVRGHSLEFYGLCAGCTSSV